MTRADVERVVRRDFPPERVAEVVAMLDEYGPDEWHSEPERVRLAVLKLAAGNLERLRYELEGAKCDYRDVLSPAEYPGYCKRVWGRKQVSPEEEQRVIDADWKHYQDWLTR
ncbi:MAG TPA: hypothetical protein VK615_17885 [Candidatus Binatia bacterium]|nr:hypothetical protein [Candidatus Binatia bacterium]